MNQSPYVTRRKAAIILLYAVARAKALKAKQAAMAMDCKKAKRGKAAVSEAKAEKGSTGNRPPSSLGGNTTNPVNTTQPAQMSGADAYGMVSNDPNISPELKDRVTQRDYANRMANINGNVVTYRYDEKTGKVYVVIDNQEFESSAGSQQLAHYQYELGKNGDSLDKMLKNSGDYVIVGEQGLGTGMTTTNSSDVYDDRITVIMKGSDGNIIIREFNRSNLESSTSGNYASIAAGKYDVTTSSWHTQSQAASQLPFSFSVNEGGQVPTLNGQLNPNPGAKYYGQQYMDEVFIHMGGSDNDWSAGCNTIYAGSYNNGKLTGGDYTSLTGMFKSYDTVRQQWNYNYGRNGTYYLIR